MLRQNRKENEGGERKKTHGERGVAAEHLLCSPLYRNMWVHAIINCVITSFKHICIFSEKLYNYSNVKVNQHKTNMLISPPSPFLDVNQSLINEI